MASLAGRGEVRGCADCHQPDPQVLEHRIGAHLEKLECYACHSAWGAQEYGTFFLRLGENPLAEVFRVRREPGSEYLRSAYLKRQDAPPLGRNAAGRVSPIRPQFIA
ncbi:MAG: cytochrome C, partial [Desulfuromonadales bacterium]|nr:cytochrome C [Desulfuromonadales bacterium]